MHGLGFDVVSDDFKVVALSEGKSVTCVYMYSVRKGLWEKLENSPYDHSLSDHVSGVLVNGALHWLACTTFEYSTAITAFDLSADKFLSLPRDINTVTFWIMKEYGVKEFWTKFEIRERSLDDSLSTLLCSITDDDDVLLEVDEEWVVYNLKENRLKDLLINVNPVTYEARTFVDSLVSP
ncbi:F-box/kelch-repeat protein At3g06240-like [Solanum stenotomum]|uniref:F-box/kelch-repeat protein At3g06240-like n=1 Tax=Solanum stenotomum TaxID=172797 RepID=UPI0020D18C16|nr:F-box/kelch-repeat protein At3g06240-like [Solanum stenotomum]